MFKGWNLSYITDIAGWWPLVWRSFWQHSRFIRKQVVPIFLPKTFVYRHNVALCSKDVLVIGSVQGVVLIKQLQLKTDMHDCKTMFFKKKITFNCLFRLETIVNQATGQAASHPGTERDRTAWSGGPDLSWAAPWTFWRRWATGGCQLS